MNSKYSLAVLIVGGLAVLLLLGSAFSATQGGSLEEIRSDHRSDNISASGAPQQQVVNGWTTHAYLELVSEQQARQERVMAFGLAALVAIAALGVVGSSGVPSGRNEPASGWSIPAQEKPSVERRGPTAPPGAPGGGAPPT